jgi:hypothetical protein
MQCANSFHLAGHRAPARPKSRFCSDQCAVHFAELEAGEMIADGRMVYCARCDEWFSGGHATPDCEDIARLAAEGGSLRSQPAESERESAPCWNCGSRINEDSRVCPNCGMHEDDEHDDDDE